MLIFFRKELKIIHEKISVMQEISLTCESDP